jgi:hypothetical protein
MIEYLLGQLKDGKIHGKGKMDFHNGDKYTGDWIDGNMTGQGVSTLANGTRSEGQFKDNRMHGKGTMDYANGTKYTGDWVDDIRTGQGVLIFADGHRYEIICSQSLRSRCMPLKFASVLFVRNN